MKIFTGKVISKKMQGTATVVVERFMNHPRYKKRLKKTKKYHVHDELGSEVGQIIRFIASRPYSKTKKWKVISADGADGERMSRRKSRSLSKKTKGEKTQKKSAELVKESV